MTEEKPRWLYRFDNYQRAFFLLREAVESLETRRLSQLEKEGLIQRFEFTWELAWKVMKDYLQQEGVVLDVITPASVIRGAFAANLIADGDAWMLALEDRNLMAHTYDIETFERIIDNIRRRCLALFDALHADLSKKSHA